MAILKHIREQVHNKYNKHCAYCGDPIEYKAMQVDHIIPKSNFNMHIVNKWKVPDFLSHLTKHDVDHIDNLNPACRVCNKRKDTYYLELFREEIYLQVERANKTSTNYRMAKKYGLVKETLHPIVFYFEKHDWVTVDVKSDPLPDLTHPNSKLTIKYNDGRIEILGG